MFFRQVKEGHNEWWMYLLGVFALIFGYFLGQLPLFYVQSRAVEEYGLGTAEVNRFSETMDFGILQLSNNQGIFLLFSIFVFATLTFLAVVKWVHKKSLKGLITPRSKINYPKIIYGIVVWLLLSLIFEAICYFISPDNYYVNVDWSSFIVLVLICMTLLPIQTTLEELFFRSYLMKWIGMAQPSRWVPLVVTTILFALVHGTNPEVGKYGATPMMIYYVSAGLILGIMTIMDDGLELAIGVHIATNFYGAVFMSYESSVLQTDSIWRMQEVNPWMMASIFIVSGAIFLWLSYKMFDWPSFAKLRDRIQLDETNPQ